LKVLHLIRDPGDELAWEAARAEPAAAEVKVVLLRGGGPADGAGSGGVAPRAAEPAAGAGTPGSRGLEVVELGDGLDYDGLMALIEWSDKVVAW
jgi:hypothetical protein